MKFCENCNLTMGMVSDAGKIQFKCLLCNNIIDGDPSDARVSGATNESDATADLNSVFIQNAALDPVNQKVDTSCPNCGIAYLTQIRVGQSEIVIHVCECGYRQQTNSTF